MEWLIGGGIILLIGLLKKGSSTATPASTTPAGATSTTPTGAGAGITPYALSSQPVTQTPATGMTFSAALRSATPLAPSQPSSVSVGVSLLQNRPVAPVAPAIQNKTVTPFNAGTRIGITRIPSPSTPATQSISTPTTPRYTGTSSRSGVKGRMLL